MHYLCCNISEGMSISLPEKTYSQLDKEPLGIVLAVVWSVISGQVWSLHFVRNFLLHTYLWRIIVMASACLERWALNVYIYIHHQVVNKGGTNQGNVDAFTHAPSTFTSNNSSTSKGDSFNKDLSYTSFIINTNHLLHFRSNSTSAQTDCSIYARWNDIHTVGLARAPRGHLKG